MTERDIFLAVLDLPDPAARAAYLDRVCAGDAILRSHVDALIRSYDAADSFLAEPAVSPGGPDHAVTEGYAATIDRDAGADRTSPGAESEDDSLAFLSPPGRPDALGRIGHYEVLEVLGRGGFGIVFRAFDEVLQRVVALKVLAPQMAATSPARKRFLREARSSAQVRHENVVQVYAVEEQPLPYLVMEFIPGETLQQRLDRTGPLDVAEVLRIGRQVAEGLAAAHAQGLIHRDVKPANVLIEGGAQQRVKLTDFGLARAADDASISQSGVVAGTPMYMAPEQAKGETLDHRADLFSLGSVLYAMLSGHPPFRASGTMAVLKRVCEDDPRPIREVIPEVPDWMCGIVSKLHAKNSAERFQSAREVADLLADCETQWKAHGSVPTPISVYSFTQIELRLIQPSRQSAATELR
jgi:serine/threonine protein kinase